MAVTREDVLSSPDTGRFLDGAVFLSQTLTPYTPEDLNGFLPGPARPAAEIVGTAAAMGRAVSWWDLLSWWHLVTMSLPTAGSGNRAHRGPVFLPWHRIYLRQLEEILQQVWGDDELALPWWDWAADGQAPPDEQPQAALWDDQLLGPARGVVDTGRLGDLRVRLWENVATGRLQAIEPRPIFRDAGRGRPGLPDRAQEAAALADGAYDRAPWGARTDSFRGKVEGWTPPSDPPGAGPWMHNLVHVWVGGDMTPGTSPNDPAFWLNHCNADRLWQVWMDDNGPVYRPAAGEGPDLQRIDSPLWSPFAAEALTPGDVLDPGPGGLDWYVYAPAGN